jgi:hypothetical protein
MERENLLSEMNRSVLSRDLVSVDAVWTGNRIY